MMNIEVLFVPYPVKNAQGEYEVVVSDAMVLIHFVAPTVLVMPEKLVKETFSRPLEVDYRRVSGLLSGLEEHGITYRIEDDVVYFDAYPVPDCFGLNGHCPSYFFKNEDQIQRAYKGIILNR